jgi:hypothetical protein
MDIVNKDLIKEKLQIQKCDVHGTHPEIEIKNGGISIKGCCVEFENKLSSIAADLATENVADNIIGNLFK